MEVLVEFTAAHNLYIDENGICYIFGASQHMGVILQMELSFWM